MATWASIGHAMRRRAGMPSNHLESAGSSMSRNNLTPEEILASAEHANSPRRYMGMDSAKFTSPSAAPVAGTLIGKKNTQAGNNYGVTSPRRTPILAERLGSRYAISVKFPKGTSPEAGATMANARIVPSVQGKNTPNFESGMQSSY